MWWLSHIMLQSMILPADCLVEVDSILAALCITHNYHLAVVWSLFWWPQKGSTFPYWLPPSLFYVNHIQAASNLKLKKETVMYGINLELPSREKIHMRQTKNDTILVADSTTDTPILRTVTHAKEVNCQAKLTRFFQISLYASKKRNVTRLI